MSTLRALVRVSLIGTLALAGSTLSLRAQDAEPEADIRLLTRQLES